MNSYAKGSEHLTESIFVHFPGHGNLISEGYLQYAAKCQKYIQPMLQCPCILRDNYLELCVVVFLLAASPPPFRAEAILFREVFPESAGYLNTYPQFYTHCSYDEAEQCNCAFDMAFRWSIDHQCIHNAG